MDEPVKLKPVTICPLCDQPVTDGQLIVVKCPVHVDAAARAGPARLADELLQLGNPPRAVAVDGNLAARAARIGPHRCGRGTK
jgi:hypothetical protein